MKTYRKIFCSCSLILLAYLGNTQIITEKQLIMADPIQDTIIGISNVISGTKMASATSYGIAMYELEQGKWVPKQFLPGTYATSSSSHIAMKGSRLVSGYSSSIGGTNKYYGVVKVYDFDGTSWNQSAEIETPDSSYAFGSTLDFSGDKLVVGARGGQGALFFYDKIGANWQFRNKVVHNETDTYTFFPTSVSMDGSRAVASDYRDTLLWINGGVVYYLEDDGTNWQIKTRMESQSSGEHFGVSTAILGNRMAIGAPYFHTSGSVYYYGTVYIYDYDGVNWNKTAQLRATDEIHEANFGMDLVLQTDRIAVFSANCFNRNGYRGPNVNLFDFDGTSWMKKAQFIANMPNSINYPVSQPLAAGGDEIVMGIPNYYGTTGLLAAFSYTGTAGEVFVDMNQNGTKNYNDFGVAYQKLVIKPENQIVTTNRFGTWHLPALPAGTHTITVDTTGYYPTTPITQSFTNMATGFKLAPGFGLYPLQPCSSPHINITNSIFRPCFDNWILVTVRNEHSATADWIGAYATVQLDTAFNVDSASMAMTVLGNNNYRIDFGDLAIGEEKKMYIYGKIACSTPLGLTLCYEANAYPVPSCAPDSIPHPPNPVSGLSSCTLPWDKSSIKVSGSCTGDSIRLVVYNHGSGDMQCYAPVRYYKDAILLGIDSLKLNSGDSLLLMVVADGHTWRVEVDQHPLHPGYSHPTATIEHCGDLNNWISGLPLALPQDDAAASKAISCGITNLSYDPNDKTGYPTGVGTAFNIVPDQEINYRIRFQNTGTDTAFTVVIRDTLDPDLDLMSFRMEGATHPYTISFGTQGAVEWRFENILLPDSNVNEPASHGQLNYTIKPLPGKANGTEILNSAAIYFDFNAPVLTNQTKHSLSSCIQRLSVNTISETVCSTYTAPDGQVYNTSGTYKAVIPTADGCDSTITINLTMKQATTNTINETVCNTYIAPDGQVYNSTGQYTAILPNAQACDSTITINLTVNHSSASSISETVCGSYTAPDGQVYNSTGQYTAILPNAQACDSTITINLTVNHPGASSISENVCGSYTAPDGQVYTTSGSYSAVIPTAGGCDSTITINLMVNQPTFATVTETACQHFLAADGLIYTQSGNYVATIPNAAGCDSTITYQLTIKEVDTSLTVLEPMLSSNASGGTYQWLDCQNGMQPIAGATQQDYQATEDGVYAVIIEINGCKDTSACQTVNLVGIHEAFQSEFKLYPNPGDGIFHIDLGQNHLVSALQITDLTGRIIRSMKTGSDQIVAFELHDAKGIYLVHLLNDQKQSIAVLNLMKE